MKLHTIFEGGPANGILASVTVGQWEKDEAPSELKLVPSSDASFIKTTAHVYRLVEVADMPGPGQYSATYRYSHDYNDLPVTLVDYLF